MKLNCRKKFKNKTKLDSEERFVPIIYEMNFLWKDDCWFKVACLVELSSKYMQEKRIFKFLQNLVLPVCVN